MATISHKTLTSTQIHEPKGADTAAVDKVYVADGAGSGAWAKLDADSLTGTGNAFGAQLFHIRDQKSSADGGTFTSGSAQTRTLNTSVTNEISGASLASNQVTLPAGTYFIDGSAPALSVNNHQTYWYNVTDASTTLNGTVEQSTSAGAYAQTRSLIRGRFTIAAQKVFELRHWCTTTQATYGFGEGSAWGTSVYSDICIWKIA